MTLISSIIVDAYRESNMLALGQEPTGNQGTEALRLYNQILTSTYGGEAGERLVDWPLGVFGYQPGDDTGFTADRLAHPEINQRLLALNLAPLTVYLPDCPQDGARMGIADPYSRLSGHPVTLDGNGRPIEATASIVLDTDGMFREWLYRADKAAWVRISDVLAADENPFPPQYDIMFTILLAMRLNPRYGRTLDAQSVAMLKQNKREFVARYLQSRPLDTDDSISWPFLSRQGYNSAGVSSTAAFNAGRVRGA